MKRFIRRLRSIGARIENTRYWIGRGMSLGHAWVKADVTFNHSKQP
jgi:hypothetical protein